VGDVQQNTPSGTQKPDPAPSSSGENKNQTAAERGPKEPKQQANRRPVWPLLLAVLIMSIFIGVVLYIIFRPRPNVWTDDAYVTVHYATIAPRISGQVASVLVDDNQVVKIGQVLVTLDPRDNETAVAAAQATLARDRATFDEVSANVIRQTPIIEEQKAAVASAAARLQLAHDDARRYGNLATTGAGTVRQHQEADTTLQQDQASLDSAQASLDAAIRQLEVLKAQRLAAAATVKSDVAHLEQAELNLSYTLIRSPLDGMVGERSVQVGDYVGPGTTLMTLVPLDQVYINANYREVDLRHVRSGQPVTIHVDAYNINLDGIVDSLPPASGISFSPIPPNNATGNFTKIVQRLPVKIVLKPGQPLAKLLRVGFSVETTIHTGLENVVGEQRDSSRRVTEH
jgi:membrane fusion protein, multidrug efflux system